MEIVTSIADPCCCAGTSDLGAINKMREWVQARRFLADFDIISNYDHESKIRRSSKRNPPHRVTGLRGLISEHCFRYLEPHDWKLRPRSHQLSPISQRILRPAWPLSLLFQPSEPPVGLPNHLCCRIEEWGSLKECLPSQEESQQHSLEHVQRMCGRWCCRQRLRNWSLLGSNIQTRRFHHAPWLSRRSLAWFWQRVHPWRPSRWARARNIPWGRWEQEQNLPAPFTMIK